MPWRTRRRRRTGLWLTPRPAIDAHRGGSHRRRRMVRPLLGLAVAIGAALLIGMVVLSR